MALAPRMVTFVYGTRPEAIKLAPLILAVHEHPGLQARVVVTGQHREMLRQVHEIFEIRPDEDMDLMRPGQSLTQITTRVLEGVERDFDLHPPDAVVVQGDTTTAMAGALGGYYRRTPVVHVEAGLRSGQRMSPFPEEINRRMVSVLADLHLAPTQGNRRALETEGIDPAAIVVTGNTVIDALFATLESQPSLKDDRARVAVDGALAQGRSIVTVTSHRRESWGSGIRSINRALRRLAADNPQVLWVLPAHRNPTVRVDLLEGLETVENVVVTDPLEYPEFCRLMSVSRLALTDSGGVQEEAPSLGVPVLVMRDVTERPEAVEMGTVRLVGTDEECIYEATTELLRDSDAYRSMAHAVNPYGDGRAAVRSVAAIAELLGVGQRQAEFAPVLDAV